MKCFLMHKAIPVLLMDLDEATGHIAFIYDTYAPGRTPVGVKVKGNVVDRATFNEWWTGRAIPSSRQGLREALAAMGVSSPQALLAKCHGLSLSDPYWIKPESENTRWEDVNFFENGFSGDVGHILFGQVSGSRSIRFASPDITCDGWLEKRWETIDGKHRLLKGGSGEAMQEPCNEVLASEAMRLLGVNHIPYTLAVMDGHPYSVCDDLITPETELVSAWNIIQARKRANNISPYQHFLDCCEALGIPDARENIDKMLVVDYIISNEDRHWGNFGAIRNADSLEWIGLAPVFDSGTSLWHDIPTPIIRPLAKAPSKPFRKSHNEQVKLIGRFDWFENSALEGIGEVFSGILSQSPTIDDTRRIRLCNALEKRVEMMSDIIDGKQQGQEP